MRRFTLLFDCGDTIIDEGTELKDEKGVSMDGDLIPGADILLRTLGERGYTLGLVADGPVLSFRNLLGKHGLYELFAAYAISEEVGVCKPAPLMFQKALDDLGIPPDHFDRVIMVGNNLKRDIAGANDLGLRSVWLDWAQRRLKNPATPSQIPDATIKQPLELLDVLEKWENEGLPIGSTIPG